jgi:hypothetical protein
LAQAADVRLHIRESILPMVVDSGFARFTRAPGMTEKESFNTGYGRFGSNRFSSPFQQSA